MRNFFWKAAALTLVLLGDEKQYKRMVYARAYGASWKKTVHNLRKRHDDTPSGQYYKQRSIG